MLLKHVFILGLHAIFLMQITHSLVLLTANLEDVRKLAKKFVSDSLALQIAQFLAKANEKTINVSEENEKQETQDKYSEIKYKDEMPIENRMTQIPMQDTEENPKKHHHQNDIFDRQNDLIKSTEGYPHQNDIFDRQYDLLISKERFHHQNDIFDRKSDLSRSRVQTFQAISHETKESSVATTQHHQDKQNTASSYIADYEAKMAHIMKAVNENKKPPRKQKKKYSAHKSGSFLSRTGRTESNRYRASNPPKFALMSADKIDQVSKNINDTDSSKLNTVTTRHIKLSDNETAVTSHKAKTEFDQYDYTKYPKSKFVATSGLVALPKVSNEKTKDDEVKLQTEWS